MAVNDLCYCYLYLSDLQILNKLFYLFLLGGYANSGFERPRTKIGSRPPGFGLTESLIASDPQQFFGANSGFPASSKRTGRIPSLFEIDVGFGTSKRAELPTPVWGTGFGTGFGRLENPALSTQRQQYEGEKNSVGFKVLI